CNQFKITKKQTNVSWDVILIKEQFDTNDKDYEPISLGIRDNIINELCILLPELDYSVKDWGILNGDGFSIEFNTGKEEKVDSIMLHIRGGGNPHYIIGMIMKKMEWEALDCSTGEFVDLKNINAESWTKFQTWRDKIFKRNKLN
ncbi:hypothetical protein, partial [Cellulophaga baltica]|uniref:hypothetical protein n=1 Tax=Cellulophaga baltica TaxID=76594 RepID=UPI001C70CC0A